MLTFCQRCENVMVLKERLGSKEGLYECRCCGLEVSLPLGKIMLREDLNEEHLQVQKVFSFPF